MGIQHTEHKFTTKIGRPRDRVKGPGPDRKELPNFKELGDIPESVMQELLTTYGKHRNINHLNSKDYEIKEKCELAGKVPAKFQHILLQDKDPYMDQGFDELKYTSWTKYATNPVIKWLNNKFPNSYRARISILHPGELFDWHIDTNTSVACRVSCALNNEGSTFEINRKGVIESRDFPVGKMIFTNTGYPHRVYNSSDKPRINLLFGIDYKDIECYFKS